VLDGGQPGSQSRADQDEAPSRSRRPEQGRRAEPEIEPEIEPDEGRGAASGRGRQRGRDDRAARERPAERGQKGRPERSPRGRAAEPDEDDYYDGRGRIPRSRSDRRDEDEEAGRRRTARSGATRTTAGGSRVRATASGRRTESVGRKAAPRRVAGGRPVKAAPPPRQTTKRPPVVAAEPPKLANSTRRLRLGTVLALALFVTIGVRLVVMQVVESPAEAASLQEARKNRLTEIVLPAARGSILDRDGAVLAHSVEARYIYADPELVQDPVAVAAQLSPLLGIAASELIKDMTKGKRPGGGAIRFSYLARGVDVAVADKIAAMKLKGIREDRDERRDIPGADLASNLIGFTGEEHTGLEGLEARYDELLRGTDGERVFETGNPNVDNGDLAKEIPGGFHQETPAQNGTSLELTIDRDLQFEVQRFLSEDMQRVNATIGAAVVLDAQTGEVRAQASYPAYNAAKPFDSSPSDRDDVATSVVADPGSTHKAFTLAAALQEGVITPSSTITVGPALSRGGYTFADSHQQKAGTKLTIPGVLAYSSNVGTILIADKLGKDRLYAYQQKFGLGQATDEGMPGEAAGRLLTPAEWSGSASGSVPIGMSVDATLMQMVAGYATIANNGTYIQPHLITSTIAPDGTVKPAAAPETHRVLSPEIARQMRSMMEAVVDVKGATGTQAAVNGFRVAGKTGTGKMLTDGRYTTHNAGSFIGMAPADNPRFVIGVFADVPDGTGGDVAAPAFSKMMSFALLHYRVPPSATKPPSFKIYP
jgi:cell division protein FtsI (penicillin-binding protein 3)